MNEGQKPSKRRWRKIVVALVLVVGLLVTWWNWPRGDARFLGKWELWKPGLDAPAGYLEFCANGMMTESSRRDQRSGQWSPWKCEGTTLRMGWEVGSFGDLADSISAVVFRQTNWWPVVRSAGPWEFHVMDADTIEIRLDDDNVFALRRTRE